ncbi:hypothetical protein ABPG75_009353 [Micractinium tetrahymenae]
MRSRPPPSGAATGSQLAALLRALRRGPLAELTLVCGPRIVKELYKRERFGGRELLYGLPCLPAAADYSLLCTTCTFFDVGSEPLGLLTSLRPRTAPHLGSLTLKLGSWRIEEESLVVLPALRGCPALASLTSLQVHFRASEDACAAAVLAVLLEQAPALQEPELDGCRVLPPCVRSYRGLRRLDLHSWQLTELPPGAYLAGPEGLSLGGGAALDRLPPALPSAWRASPQGESEEGLGGAPDRGEAPRQ